MRKKLRAGPEDVPPCQCITEWIFNWD